MTLTVEVEQNGIEHEIDLDELDRYGSYHVDRERGLIIKASIYSRGTRDSRHVRGDVTCGTDYTVVPVEVDGEAVREYAAEQLHVELRDEELENAIESYKQTGVEIVNSFDEMLGGYRILSKATSGIVSTDDREPLLGWEEELDDVVDRAYKKSERRTRREIVREVFNGLRQATPGDHEYSARVELVTPES